MTFDNRFAYDVANNTFLSEVFAWIFLWFARKPKEEDLFMTILDAEEAAEAMNSKGRKICWAFFALFVFCFSSSVFTMAWSADKDIPTLALDNTVDLYQEEIKQIKWSLNVITPAQLSEDLERDLHDLEEASGEIAVERAIVKIFPKLNYAMELAGNTSLSLVYFAKHLRTCYKNNMDYVPSDFFGDGAVSEAVKQIASLKQDVKDIATDGISAFVAKKLLSQAQHGMMMLQSRVIDLIRHWFQLGGRTASAIYSGLTGPAMMATVEFHSLFVVKGMTDRDFLEGTQTMEELVFSMYRMITGRWVLYLFPLGLAVLCMWQAPDIFCPIPTAILFGLKKAIAEMTSQRQYNSDYYVVLVALHHAMAWMYSVMVWSIVALFAIPVTLMVIIHYVDVWCSNCVMSEKWQPWVADPRFVNNVETIWQENMDAKDMYTLGLIGLLTLCRFALQWLAQCLNATSNCTAIKFKMQRLVYRIFACLYYLGQISWFVLVIWVTFLAARDRNSTGYMDFDEKPIPSWIGHFITNLLTSQ
jgi:hypothetical protein